MKSSQNLRNYISIASKRPSLANPNHSKPPYLNYGKFWNATQGSLSHPRLSLLLSHSLFTYDITRGSGRGTQKILGWFFFRKVHHHMNRVTATISPSQEHRQGAPLRPSSYS